jgi:hypothetical protein
MLSYNLQHLMTLIKTAAKEPSSLRENEYKASFLLLQLLLQPKRVCSPTVCAHVIQVLSLCTPHSAKAVHAGLGHRHIMQEQQCNCRMLQ